MRGYRAAEERSILASASVNRAKLLLLLLLTLLRHSRMLRLADTIGEPGDWIQRRESSSAARMWWKRRIGRGEVIVELSLNGCGVFSVKKCTGKSNQTFGL